MSGPAPRDWATLGPGSQQIFVLVDHFVYNIREEYIGRFMAFHGSQLCRLAESSMVLEASCWKTAG